MLADRLKTLVPSATLAMNAKARAMRAQGIDVISFSVGEPDFDTPKRIKDAAVRALDKGQTKYTEVGGIAELRAAVCHKLKRDHGLEYAPDEVTVFCGAKHTLYNIVMALVNPGDEVLIPSPYWVSYPEQVRLLGGVPVPVPTHESTGFDLDPAAVARAVTSRTKLIILDSPGNPTGAVFSRAALDAVAKLALEHGLWVVSDECYEALTYEGRHVSIAFQRGAKSELLIPDVMRRRLTLTGSTLRPRSVEFKTMVADEIAKTVWPYVEGGRLKPVIDSVFPLTQAADAHARMDAGDHVGKIVLEVRDEAGKEGG